MKEMSEDKPEWREDRKMHIFLCVMIVFITPLLSMATASADGGMIPYHEFSVYEPGQKAIIAWDGEQEIMILSVDVYSEESTKALHMVPFPSLPEVELGEVKSFEKLEEIMNRDRWKTNDLGGYGNDSETAAPGGNVQIVFHEQVGPHDITAVRINSPIEFTKWVDNFLTGKGIPNKELPAELDTVVSHYTQQNIRHFVFDVIELDPNEKSVDPIVYTFQSNYLFFPLEISSIIEGNSEITLALITPTELPISTTPLNDLGFYREYNGVITYKNLMEVNEEIANMFVDKSCLSLYKGYFSLTDLENDVIVRKLVNVNWMYTETNNFVNYQVSDIERDGDKEIILLTNEKVCTLDAGQGNMLHVTDLGLVEDFTYYFYYYHQLGDVNSDGIVDIIALTTDYEIRAINGAECTGLWDIKLDDSQDTYINSLELSYDANGMPMVIASTRDSIYLLNGKDGNVIWNWEINDNDDIIRSANGIDIDNDGQVDVIVILYDGTVVALNGGTGAELWRKDLLKIYQVSAADIASNPGMELICRSQNNIYVLAGKTGATLWSTEEANYNWNNLRPIKIHDINNDNKLEILIYEPHTSTIYVLAGENGGLLDKITLSIESSNIDFSDLDSDGEFEIIAWTYTKLHVLNIDNGTELWEFTTGDPISHYEITDLDDDGYNEVLVATGNKLYTVEYSEEQSNGKAGKWQSEQGILIGSILLPIIVVVLLVVLIFKAFEKRKGQNY